MNTNYLDNEYLSFRKLKTESKILDLYKNKEEWVNSVISDPLMFAFHEPSDKLNFRDKYLESNLSVVRTGTGVWPCRVIYPEQFFSIMKMEYPIIFVKVSSYGDNVEVQGGNHLKAINFFRLSFQNKFYFEDIVDPFEIYQGEKLYHNNKIHEEIRLRFLNLYTEEGGDISVFSSNYFTSSDQERKYSRFNAIFFHSEIASHYAKQLCKHIKCKEVITYGK